MPALDFPSSPTNGQIFGQYVYDSTKGAWRVSSQVGTAVVSSATAPTSPVAGNMWFNTNDGVLFVYYDDGNTSQWVEVKSNTASGSTVAARIDAIEAKPSGLVALIPSSVTVASGSASVASDGTVTFTAVSGIAVDGLFSSTYRNYRMMTDAVSVNNAIYLWQGRASGTTTTSANYYYNELYASAGSVGASGAGSGVIAGRTGYMEAGTFTSISKDIYSPFMATHTQSFSTQGRLSGTTPVLVNNMGGCSLTTQFTGLYLSPSAGTFTGTMKFYGYR